MVGQSLRRLHCSYTHTQQQRQVIFLLCLCELSYFRCLLAQVQPLKRTKHGKPHSKGWYSIPGEGCGIKQINTLASRPLNSQLVLVEGLEQSMKQQDNVR